MATECHQLPKPLIVLITPSQAQSLRVAAYSNLSRPLLREDCASLLGFPKETTIRTLANHRDDFIAITGEYRNVPFAVPVNTSSGEIWTWYHMNFYATECMQEDIALHKEAVDFIQTEARPLPRIQLARCPYQEFGPTNQTRFLGPKQIKLLGNSVFDIGGSLPMSIISWPSEMCAAPKDTSQMLLTCELTKACPGWTLEVPFTLVDEIPGEFSNAKARVSAVLAYDISCNGSIDMRNNIYRLGMGDAAPG